MGKEERGIKLLVAVIYEERCNELVEEMEIMRMEEEKYRHERVILKLIRIEQFEIEREMRHV